MNCIWWVEFYLFIILIISCIFPKRFCWCPIDCRTWFLWYKWLIFCNNILAHLNYWQLYFSNYIFVKWQSIKHLSLGQKCWPFLSFNINFNDTFIVYMRFILLNVELLFPQFTLVYLEYYAHLFPWNKYDADDK